ncbi:MAG: TonB-dependent receptor, partial [Desulfobacteraceae bacterium]
MKKIKILIPWSLLCILLFSPTTRAENQAEEKVYEMEKVVVTARQKSPDYVQDIVSTTEISQPHISSSILDTLADKPGIQLLQSSINSTESNKIRLRGFDETRLKVLKDGVPIHRDGSYGQGPIDWSILSGEDVERIEIHRGAGPVKFGEAVGGVINIITRKPDKTSKTDLSTVYGSFETLDSKASHAGKKGPIGWRVSAGHYETDGYLRNNFSDRNNFGGTFFLDLPHEIELGIGMTYCDSETGNAVYNRSDSPSFKGGDPVADELTYGGPGIGARLLQGSTAWGDGSKIENENTSFSAFAQKEFSSGHLRTDFRLWNQEYSEVYYDAANRGKKIYERTTRAEDNNWLWQIQGDIQFSNHQLELGGETKRYGWGEQTIDYIDESYFNPSINFMTFIKDGFKGQEDLLSYSALYVQDKWQFHPKMSLEAGLRQEWFHADSVDPDAFGYEWETGVQDLDEDHLDPRANLVMNLWKNNQISAGIGIVHRYPTSPEYFWWYLNNSTDFFNTDLNAEEALQYELAVEQTLLKRLKLGLRGYYYDISDYISSTTISGIGSVYYNIAEVNIKGIEFSIAADLPHHIKPWANFTWQEGEKSDDPWDTENELTGELQDLPDTIFNIGIDYIEK